MNGLAVSRRDSASTRSRKSAAAICENPKWSESWAVKASQQDHANRTNVTPTPPYVPRISLISISNFRPCCFTLKFQSAAPPSSFGPLSTQTPPQDANLSGRSHVFSPCFSLTSAVRGCLKRVQLSSGRRIGMLVDTIMR
jgi:hypothetical protein